MFGDKIQRKGYSPFGWLAHWKWATMAAKIQPVRLSSSFVLGQKTMGSHLQSVSQLQSFESDSLLGIFVQWRPFGDEVVTIFIKDTNVINQWFTEGSSNKKTRRKKK